VIKVLKSVVVGPLERYAAGFCLATNPPLRGQSDLAPDPRPIEKATINTTPATGLWSTSKSRITAAPLDFRRAGQRSPGAAVAACTSEGHPTRGGNCDGFAAASDPILPPPTPSEGSRTSARQGRGSGGHFQNIRSRPLSAFRQAALEVAPNGGSLTDDDCTR
jgi:hypothetical protein